jgi:hypothetical protein
MISAYSRAALVVVCVLVLVGIMTAGRWLPPAATDAPPVQAETQKVAQSTAIKNCQTCHAEVWQEWESSFHAESFRHTDVQAAFRHFGHDRQCESCHAPEPILHDLASPVVLRATNRETGVDCLVCHALPDGRIAARNTVDNAPCRPVATPALTTSQHCGKCHTAILTDWDESSFHGTEKNCQFCHMPAVASRPGGRSHLCLGGHDEATLRRGAKFTARVEGQNVVVEVVNDATGHNYPGERHNRVLLVQIIERDAGGEITLARQEIIKAMTPFRGESSAERIKAGETFQATFPIVPPATKADVQLLYKLFPYLADREALVVDQAELELP